MMDFSERELMDGSISIYNDAELVEFLKTLLPYKKEINSITISMLGGESMNVEVQANET